MLWCGAFLVGLAMPKLGIITNDIILPIISALLLLFCIKKWRFIAIPAVVASGLLLGLWRGSTMELSLNAYQPLFDQKAVVEGIIREDPSYDDKSRLELRLGEVTVRGKSLPGVIRIITFEPVQPKRGEKIKAEGTLREGFGNYQAAIYFAKVNVLETQTSWFEQVRHTFTASVLTYMPEPQASLGLGFLIGLKSQLPDNLGEQLKVLGLTHIVVASGYNLTILVRLGRRLFAKYSKYQALLCSVFLMAGFVAMTGFSASMSRAALVTSLALAAWYYGRHIHPLLLLLIAAAITAAINPSFLWSDIGWWLSFLAFAGVLLGAPLVQHRFFGDKQPHWLLQILIETMCAQIVTLPLILFIFGDLSVLSVIANALILPLIPFVMLLVFLAGLMGMVMPLFASWMTLPAIWLLTYMTEVVSALSALSWASMAMPVSLAGMILLYAAIMLTGVLLLRTTKHDYLSKSFVE